MELIERLSIASVKRLCRAICQMTFADTQILNRLKVPTSGGTIFVGKHSNQFIDGAVVLTALPGRDPRFLIADKSLHRPIIGHLARLAGCVGVKRNQDIAYMGRGRIRMRHLNENEFPEVEVKSFPIVLEGDEKCDFRADVRPGDSLKIGEVLASIIHLAADGNTAMASVPSELDLSESGIHEFKVFPKIEQKHVYQKVTDRLRLDGSIVMFPEGGSHDQSDLLSLKPGVAIMALEAVSAGVTAVQICPLGIFYDDPSKFQSLATVAMGTCIAVTKEEAAAYAVNKRAAVGDLMQKVKEGLEEITITAEDRESILCVKLARALYPPAGAKVTPAECHELTCLFSKLFRLESGQNKSGKERWAALKDSLLRYGRILRVTGLQDSSVPYLEKKLEDFGWSLMARVPRASFHLLMVLVVMPIWGPVRVATSFYAEIRRRQAVNQSTVKLSGEDVITSYKMILLFVILPICAILASIASAALFLSNYFCIMAWVLSITGYSFRIFQYGNYAWARLSKFFELAQLYFSAVLDRMRYTSSIDSSNMLCASRLQTVKLLRVFIKSAFEENQGNQRYEEIKTRLLSVVPELVIERDNDRIELTQTRSYLSSEYMSPVVDCGDEIF